MSTLHINNNQFHSHGFEKLIEYQKIALRIVKNSAGNIGIVLTYPLFFATRVVILFSARSMYKAAIKVNKAILSDISVLDERELIEAHLEIKSINNKIFFHSSRIEKIINISFPTGIIKDHVMGYLSESIKILADSEQTLKSAAYPSSLKPLTQEEMLSKVDKFQKWDKDWQNEDYAIYETSYSN